MKSISLHPNPIFEREGWESLNGEWDFGFSKKAIQAHCKQHCTLQIS
ncbi:hypothetical protein [uncultured Eubacterium sp.]|nr:hypothetical protein [uncultured Eubacterium sp.]